MPGFGEIRPSNRETHPAGSCPSGSPAQDFRLPANPARERDVGRYQPFAETNDSGNADADTALPLWESKWLRDPSARKLPKSDQCNLLACDAMCKRSARIPKSAEFRNELSCLRLLSFPSSINAGGATKEGWLIGLPRGSDTSSPLCFRFLQIATGQWVPPIAATWFATANSASDYLSDLGSSIRRQIELVHITSKE